MGALLDYAALVEHHYVVGVLDGAESVGDDDDGLVFEQAVEVLHDNLLVIGVQRVGGLVEEEVRGVLVGRAGYQYALNTINSDPAYADKTDVEKAAAANYKPEYENTIENIGEYWIRLLVFILAFAALATITLEFIDRDKR